MKLMLRYRRPRGELLDFEVFEIKDIIREKIGFHISCHTDSKQVSLSLMSSYSVQTHKDLRFNPTLR